MGVHLGRTQEQLQHQPRSLLACLLAGGRSAGKVGAGPGLVRPSTPKTASHEGWAAPLPTCAASAAAAHEAPHEQLNSYVRDQRDQMLFLSYIYVLLAACCLPRAAARWPSIL